jgi:hypothetical protein
LFKQVSNLIQRGPLLIGDRFAHLHKQVTNLQTLAGRYGQWRTIRDGECKDCRGAAIPWYTYPAIEYLSHLDLGQFDVFEYGSGNSTLWWSTRARSVVAIESDPAWYERVTSQLQSCKANVVYRLQQDGQNYVQSLTKKFDIVVIDGRYRTECVNRFFSMSSTGTMLIFDNSDWYPGTIDSIRKSLGWVELDFHGFGPINMYTWTTSVFINPTQLQSIKYMCQLRSLAGLETNAELP